MQNCMQSYSLSYERLWVMNRKRNLIVVVRKKVSSWNCFIRKLFRGNCLQGYNRRRNWIQGYSLLCWHRHNKKLYSDCHSNWSQKDINIGFLLGTYIYIYIYIYIYCSTIRIRCNTRYFLSRVKLILQIDRLSYQIKNLNLPNQKKKGWIHAFLKCISAKWIACSLIYDLKLTPWPRFLRRYPLHHIRACFLLNINHSNLFYPFSGGIHYLLETERWIQIFEIR